MKNDLSDSGADCGRSGQITSMGLSQELRDEECGSEQQRQKSFRELEALMQGEDYFLRGNDDVRFIPERDRLALGQLDCCATQFSTPCWRPDVSGTSQTWTPLQDCLPSLLGAHNHDDARMVYSCCRDVTKGVPNPW